MAIGLTNKNVGRSSIAIGSMLLLYVLARAVVYTGPSRDFASQLGVKAAPAAVPAVADASRAELVPKKLSIPKISVDADVQEVGLTAKGNIGVPTNFTDAAWYKYGAAPGEAGSAVMDGHVDNALGLPGVFKHLSELQAGDSIFVSTAGGRTLEFKVSKVETYPYDAVPMEAISGDSGGAHLDLITCAGAWIQEARNYDQRLVVYSDLVI